MDPSGATQYGSVSNYGVTLGNIAGNRHEIIGTKIHVYTTPPHDDAIPQLLAALQSAITARNGDHPSSKSDQSHLTTYDDDDKNAWRLFRRDLIKCGFRGEHIARYSADLKAHLSELRQGECDKDVDISISHVSTSIRETVEAQEPPKQCKPQVRVTLEENVSLEAQVEAPNYSRPPTSEYSQSSRCVVVENVTVSSVTEKNQDRHPDQPRGRRRARHKPYPPEHQWQQGPHDTVSASAWSSAATVGRRPPVPPQEPQRTFAHSQDETSGPPPTAHGGNFFEHYPTYANAVPHGFQQSPPQNPYMAPPYHYVPSQDFYASAYYHQNNVFPYYQPAPHQQPREYMYGSAFTSGYAYPTYPAYPQPPRSNPYTPSPTPFPPTSKQQQPTQNYFQGEARPRPSETAPQQRPEPSSSDRRLLTWENIPETSLHPLRNKPILPEGWDWRLDQQNRLFYVDTYAHGTEKRCFWLPPVPEENVPDIPGWEKIYTLYGRIYWVHRLSTIVSYQYPGHCYQMAHTATGELFLLVDASLRKFEHWSKVELGCFQIDDLDVACQIETSVWESGISERAASKRGDLWWGNPSVKERNLKLSLWRPSVASIFSDVNVRPVAPAERKPAQGKDGSLEIGKGKSDPPTKKTESCFKPTASATSQSTQPLDSNHAEIRNTPSKWNVKETSNYQKASVEDAPEEENSPEFFHDSFDTVE